MAFLSQIPVFKRGMNGGDRVSQVRMYAWRGEKLIGEWDVGSF